MLTGADATAAKLAETVEGLYNHERIVRDMAANSSALGAARPAALIAKLVENRACGLGGKAAR